MIKPKRFFPECSNANPVIKVSRAGKSPMKIPSVLRFIALVLAFCAFSFAQEKPALTAKDLEKHTFYFDVADNRLTGDGARILTDELRGSQFVLLGEYHGSLRISEFTKAIIPVLHDAGCRHLALEIGPISAEILTEISSVPETTIFELKTFNDRYLVLDGNRTFTPIPFFSHVEDAEFLAEARRRKWNLYGLDQEFSFGYLPLIARLYENLEPPERARLKSLYEQVTQQIKTFYEADIKGEKSQYQAILESGEVKEFLDTAANKNEKNKKIAAAIRLTTEIYYLNDAKIRKYYEANSNRVRYMKKNLAEAFSRARFNFKKDKMLLKMGAVHTGRGFSDLSLFEIGNTLSELAEFHGNRSLHLNFGTRFYRQNGAERDALSDANGFLYRFQALTQMARRDNWTLIDLRPLRADVFYRRKYKLDAVVLELFKNHDFYIVPKIEDAPTPNYKNSR